MPQFVSGWTVIYRLNRFQTNSSLTELTTTTFTALVRGELHKTSSAVFK